MARHKPRATFRFAVNPLAIAHDVSSVLVDVAYVLTILVLLLRTGRSHVPEELGRPYRKGES